MVVITTRDDNVLYGFKSELICSCIYPLFESYFGDYPDAQEIDLDVTLRGAQSVFRYTTLGILPETKQEWLDFLEAANYIGFTKAPEFFDDISREFISPWTKGSKGRKFNNYLDMYRFLENMSPMSEKAKTLRDHVRVRSTRSCTRATHANIDSRLRTRAKLAHEVLNISQRIL